MRHQKACHDGLWTSWRRGGLPPSPGLRQALTVADHIRRSVMSKELMKRSSGENLGRMTVSVGVYRTSASGH